MTGKYTVNEVEERTKVPASTLRQWERRYGFPMPERSESGYRLYSERDLQQIEAMKRHIEDGVPASRAADLVQQLGVASKGPRPTQDLCKELVNALLDLDDVRADEILSEAHALHSVETVMLELLRNAMVEIGQRWHDNKIRTTTEHFASQYVQGRLRTLLGLSPKLNKSAAIIVACAPGDQHELGALIIAVMLRRTGYRVYYLGADTPIEDLVEMAETLKPLAVMVSASVKESVLQLLSKRDCFQRMKTKIIFGGLGFQSQPELARSIGGTYFEGDIQHLKTFLDGMSAGSRTT